MGDNETAVSYHSRVSRGFNIACVIVTYNRKALLGMAIDAVMAQTCEPDSLLIVDNHSDDGTSELVEGKDKTYGRIDYLRLDRNYGGAGGFYHGIKAAYERGAEWVWIMDDDSLPMTDALQRLVESEVFNSPPPGPPLGILASRVNWVDGTISQMNIPSVSWDWNYPHVISPRFTKINAASFVSLLISREAIQRVGYPIKEFFIWYDDVEYTRRITDVFSGYYVADSVVVHQIRENLGTSYKNVDDTNLWKYKYGIRNLFATLAVRRFGKLRTLLEALRVAAELRQLGKPWRIIWSVSWAGVKGAFFDYQRFIEKPSDSVH